MSRAAFNELILVHDLLDNFPTPLRVWKIHGLILGGGEQLLCFQQVLSIYLQAMLCGRLASKLKLGII
jgi:hypothetical protein